MRVSWLDWIINNRSNRWLPKTPLSSSITLQVKFVNHFSAYLLSYSAAAMALVHTVFTDHY
jgi:hypothetical protein